MSEYLDFSAVPLPALLTHRNALYGALRKATEARDGEAIGAARRCIATIEATIEDRNKVS